MHSDDEPRPQGGCRLTQRFDSVLGSLHHRHSAVGDADLAALLDAKVPFRRLLAQSVERPVKALEQLQALASAAQCLATSSASTEHLDHLMERAEANTLHRGPGPQTRRTFPIPPLSPSR